MAYRERNITAETTIVTEMDEKKKGAFSSSQYTKAFSGGISKGEFFSAGWGYLYLSLNASDVIQTGTENKPYTILSVPIYVY